jgi:hypothetical protein
LGCCRRGGGAGPCPALATGGRDAFRLVGHPPTESCRIHVVASGARTTRQGPNLGEIGRPTGDYSLVNDEIPPAPAQ